LGLIRSIGGELLVFELCMAKRASVRANQTRQGADMVYQQGGVKRDYAGKPLINKRNLDSWRDEFPHFEGGAEMANPTNIIGFRVLTPPQSSSTTGREVGDDAATAAGDGVEIGPLGASQAAPQGVGMDGVYRDQPQAASLEDGYRGRPVGGEAGVQADKACASAPVPEATSVKTGLAAGESLLDSCHGSGSLVAEYIKILNQNSVRIPRGMRGVLDEWAGRGVLVAHLEGGLLRAFEARKKAGSTQPVGLAYVDSCVKSEVSELRRSAAMLDRAVNRASDGKSARSSRESWRRRVERLARSVGISARPGEDWPDLERRVKAALDAAPDAVAGGNPWLS
jgi:hypothetical protein